MLVVITGGWQVKVFAVGSDGCGTSQYLPKHEGMIDTMLGG